MPSSQCSRSFHSIVPAVDAVVRYIERGYGGFWVLFRLIGPTIEETSHSYDSGN